MGKRTSILEAREKHDNFVFIKMYADDCGNYIDEQQNRFTVWHGRKIATPEDDVINWIQYESLDSFLQMFGLTYYQPEQNDQIL